MKIFTIILIFAFSINATHAQYYQIYNNLDFGGGVAFNTASGDAETTTGTRAFQFNLNYNVDPYKNIAADVYTGNLAGGDSLNTFSGRQFNNNFKAFSLRGELFLGQFIGKTNTPLNEVAKNVFVSSGLGIIFNNINQINRTSRMIPGFYTEGTNKSTNAFIPVRAGYQFSLKNGFNQDLAKIYLGFQQNFVLGDDIDGFKNGNYNDTFSQLMLGFKIPVGRRSFY